jgi:hypothetical protein
MTTLRHTLLAAFAAAALAAGPAVAQTRDIRPPSSIQRAFQPDYQQRDLVVMAEVLTLREDQAAVIQTLFDDYVSAFRLGARDARKRLQAVRPGDDDAERTAREVQAKLREEYDKLRQAARARAAQAPDAAARRAIMEEYQRDIQARVREYQDESRGLGLVGDGPEQEAMLEEMRVVAQAWRADARGLASAFESDVRTLLDEPQLELWPRLERRLRREKTVTRGRLAGESVDVFKLVRGLELDAGARAALASTLEPFAISLDEALVARNDYLEAHDDELYAAVRNGDASRAAAIAVRQVGLHQRVRDVNLDLVAALDAALPDETAARLREAFDQAGFPTVYRPTRAARALQAATRLGDLDEDQRAALAQLEREYLDRLRQHNEGLRQTILGHEPDAQRSQLEGLARGRDAGADVHDPVQDAFAARRELGQMFVDELGSVLSDEQLARIPGAVVRGAEPSP